MMKRIAFAALMLIAAPFTAMAQPTNCEVGGIASKQPVPTTHYRTKEFDIVLATAAGDKPFRVRVEDLEVFDFPDLAKKDDKGRLLAKVCVWKTGAVQIQPL